jgi:hypothetical protein
VATRPQSGQGYQGRISWSLFFYVQEKVRPGTGREAGLGHGRYIAIEHMDVRRDRFSVARRFSNYIVPGSNQNQIRRQPFIDPFQNKQLIRSQPAREHEGRG